MIKHTLRTINEATSNKRPIAHSGHATDSKAKLPSKKNKIKYFKKRLIFKVKFTFL